MSHVLSFWRFEAVYKCYYAVEIAGRKPRSRLEARPSGPVVAGVFPDHS